PFLIGIPAVEEQAPRGVGIGGDVDDPVFVARAIQFPVEALCQVSEEQEEHSEGHPSGRRGDEPPADPASQPSLSSWRKEDGPADRISASRRRPPHSISLTGSCS